MNKNSTNNKVPPDVGDAPGHLGNESTTKSCNSDVNCTINARSIVKSAPPGSDEDGADSIKVGQLLEKFEDVHEGWSSRAVKDAQRDKYTEWLAGVCRWKNFLTLTFKEYREPDVAYSIYIKLVHTLNERLFGDHYTRIVHHSYFNYVVGMEFTKSRAVCHFHVLTDRPMDYSFIHRWWNVAAGICWIEQVRDPVKAARYVTKYVCKAGDENMKVYLSSNHRVPRPPPTWWYMD